jgi:hypothetical protein
MDSSTAVAQKSTPVDLYYQDSTNSLVQAVSVQYDTRFTSVFPSKSAGQSVLYIPPSNGINKVMVVLEFTAAQLACINGGFALPRGWGYLACSLFSWRISGSQQYFVSGQQLLAANLRKCRTKSQRDAIYSLGGEACNTLVNDDGSVRTAPFRAYLPLSFFTAPCNDGLDTPVASDILGSQIQITVQVVPPSDYFISNSAYSGSLIPVPQEFNAAYFQVEQLTMNDRSMSLASRPGVDMNEETYIQSLRDFTQQELQAQLAAQAGTQTITLNGFMSGQVRGIQVWLTENPVAGAPAGTMTSPLNWTIPDEVICIFAGQQYAVYRNGSSEAWNLIDGTAPNSVDSVAFRGVAGGVAADPASARWCFLPFSQPSHNDYEATIMVSGLRITNGSVQLQVITPDATKAYTLHAVPVLNAALAYSRGAASLLIG